MLYRPEKGRIWDPTVIIKDGTYYMFTMYYEEGAAESYAMRLATSKDGVHWEDCGNLLVDEKYPVWKMGIFMTDSGKFFMNHGSMSLTPGHGNDTLRYFSSEDLIKWEPLYHDMPDGRWYEAPERWDHMYCIKSLEGGYIGYTVATPHENIGGMLGIQRSNDGLHWYACPPPKIEWGDIPPVREIEVGGCEKIGDKYYLIGGICPPFNGNYNYSCYTFVADNENGPFRPDPEAFRICGNNGLAGRLFMQILIAFCRNYDSAELLVSNTVWYTLDSEQNNNWFVPLKAAKVDNDGHLRLHYYNCNDALKGTSISVCNDILLKTKAHEGYQLSDEFAFADIAEFEPSKGIVLEGKIKVTEYPKRAAVRANCWRPTMAGFYFEENENRGTAFIAECTNSKNRSTYIGTLDIENGFKFTAEDKIYRGCASPTGLNTGVFHAFRILMRYGMFEIYLDDMHFQTYTTKDMPTGKIKLILQNCECELTDMKAYEMTL